MPGQASREIQPKHPFAFPREARLLCPNEFRHVFQTGKKAVGRQYICYVSRQEGTGSKLGIAVSRKVGNAVTRNRVKRHIREFFRTHRPSFQHGALLVVVARPEAADLTYHESAAALEHLLKMKGVL